MLLEMVLICPILPQALLRRVHSIFDDIVECFWGYRYLLTSGFKS